MVRLNPSAQYNFLSGLLYDDDDSDIKRKKKKMPTPKRTFTMPLLPIAPSFTASYQNPTLSDGLSGNNSASQYQAAVHGRTGNSFFCNESGAEFPSATTVVYQGENVEDNVDHGNLELNLQDLGTANEVIVFDTRTPIFHCNTATQTDISPEMSDAGFKVYVINHLSMLQVQQQKLIDSQNAVLQFLMTRGLETCTEVSANEFGELPISSLQELNDFNTKLDEMAAFKKLVQYIQGIGGNSIEDFVRRAMNRLMTDELCSKYSWKGQKKKYNFSSLHLFKAIYDALTKSKFCGQTTEKLVEFRISEHLKYAPGRIKKKESVGEVNELSERST